MPGAPVLCTMTIITDLIFESLPHVVQRTFYLSQLIITTILYVDYYYSHFANGETGVERLTEVTHLAEGRGRI